MRLGERRSALHDDTAAGAIANIPLNHELSDRQILNIQQQSADSYAEQMLDALDGLSAEAATSGGRMLPMHLTPYIIKLPSRMDAFERLLADIAARPGSWFARGCDILDTMVERPEHPGITAANSVSTTRRRAVTSPKVSNLASAQDAGHPE